MAGTRHDVVDVAAATQSPGALVTCRIGNLYPKCGGHNLLAVSETFDRVTTAVLVACSLCVTGLVVHRELAANARNASAQAASKPRYIAAWRGFDSIGIRAGPASAPVHIIEFVDYQCPACRGYDGVLNTLAQRHPRDVSWLFIHSPLSIHPFAQQAARAVECADAQSHFSAMREQVFARQDSFGLKPWSAYARQAGIVDSARFTRCLSDSSSARRIQRGMRLAQQVDLIGTPTILVNGWMFATPPTLADLEGAIDRALAGKPVVSSGGS